MTKQNKAFKFRLLPNKEQAVLLAKTFGCVRFVYNKMLAERKETYEKFKDDKEALKKQKLPTPAKYKKEFAWLKEVDSLARSEEHTSELQSRGHLVCRLLLEKKIKLTTVI